MYITQDASLKVFGLNSGKILVKDQENQEIRLSLGDKAIPKSLIITKNKKFIVSGFSDYACVWRLGSHKNKNLFRYIIEKYVETM